MLSNKLFPDLKCVKSQKHPKNVHNKVELPKNDIPSSYVKKNTADTKTIPCSNIMQGNECPYGNKCKYAHFKDEWDVKNCHHGVRCNRVTGEKCKNVDSSNVCFYRHPHEDETAFMKRLRIDTSKFKKPSDEELIKSKHFTKMCDSYFLEVPCNKSEGHCTYAHTIEQLIVGKCMFKESCNHVLTGEDGMYSTSGIIVCMFLHPDETMDNYISRVLEPRRKVVLESSSDATKETSSSDSGVGSGVRISWGDLTADADEAAEVAKKAKYAEVAKKAKDTEVAKKAKDTEAAKDAEAAKKAKDEVKEADMKLSCPPQVLVEASEEDLPKILSLMVTSGLLNFKIKVSK